MELTDTTTTSASATSTSNSADYRFDITAPVSAKEAFDKIARVSEWWMTNVEGRAERLGDIFTVRFGKDVFVTFRLTDVDRNATAVWTVTDCYLDWLKDKTEWTGTKVVWKIAEKDQATTIHFAHVGLVPGIECYDMCVKGWDQYVKGSLLKLLTENTGQPS